MNVLIVNDDMTNRKLLRALLEAEGHCVTEAPDGVEALGELDHRGADAVISDILMPTMDGYRLCHELRRNAHWPHVPFIFYTSTYLSAADEQLALDLGAEKFLRKPAPAQEILDALRDATAAPPRARQPPQEAIDETLVLREYSERLVAKLEAKNLELEERTAQLQQQADELKRANEALARSNDDLQQFAYIASHDLQTPLRTVSGFLDLLQASYAGKLDDRADDWIARAIQANRQMHTLIKDVLAYSRVEHARRPLRGRSAVGGRGGSREALERTHPLLRRRGQARGSADPLRRSGTTRAPAGEPHRQRTQVPWPIASARAHIGTHGRWALRRGGARQWYRHSAAALRAHLRDLPPPAR